MPQSSADELTRLLRESQDPLFVRLRALLDERGIDPSNSALATFFPDDRDVEFGVLVTLDRRVCEFLLRSGGVDEQTEPATILDWNDKTDWWPSTPHRSDVEAAMRLLDKEEKL